MFEETQERSSRETAACRQFDADLAAYLEGEDRSGVLSHARECAFCGVVLSDLEQIRSVSRLFTHEEPSPRVWANLRLSLVAEGIIRTPEIPWWSRWARIPSLPNLAPVGALACLLILGSVLLVPTRPFEQRQPTEQIAGQAVSPQAFSLRSAEDTQLAVTVGELEINYRAQAVSFEPAVKAAYRRSLDSLNDSIRECLESLQRRPADTLVQDYLLTAYERKAEVIASALEFDTR